MLFDLSSFNRRVRLRLLRFNVFAPYNHIQLVTGTQWYHQRALDTHANALLRTSACQSATKKSSNLTKSIIWVSHSLI